MHCKACAKLCEVVWECGEHSGVWGDIVAWRVCKLGGSVEALRVLFTSCERRVPRLCEVKSCASRSGEACVTTSQFLNIQPSTRIHQSKPEPSTVEPIRHPNPKFLHQRI